MSDATAKPKNTEPRFVEATVHMTFSQFQIPPVRDALIIGRRAPIGSNALQRALDVLMPEQFRRIEVDHPIIEAILVRESDLRKVPAERFVSLLVDAAQNIMDERDVLRVDVNIEITAVAQLTFDGNSD